MCVQISSLAFLNKFIIDQLLVLYGQSTHLAGHHSLGKNGCKQQHTCDRHIREMGDERLCPGSIAHVAETSC